MKRIFMFCLATATFIFGQHNHVFWYKCIQNNYSVSDSPGPNIPANSILHEGMILSSSMRADGYPSPSFALHGYGDPIFGCFWSKDLQKMQGNALSASLRFENISFNKFQSHLPVAGNLEIRVGIADFSSIIAIYSGTDQYFDGQDTNISATSMWLSPTFPLNYTMGYNESSAELMAETTIILATPNYPADTGNVSFIAGTFTEIDVTKQVNWILSHSGSLRGNLSGQYAIVFLPSSENNSIGHITSYSNESCSTSALNEASWTNDGNTCHLYVEGELTEITSVESSGTNQSATPGIFSVSPNPFKNQALISFNKSAQQKRIKIFDLKGRCIRDFGTSSEESIVWKASGLGAGFYFLVMEMAGHKYQRSILLIK